MKTQTKSKFPWIFLILVFVLAVPFYLLGDRKTPLPINLPWSALVLVVPALAGAVQAFVRAGWHGVRELLKRTLDIGRIHNKWWLVAAFALAPAVYFAAYGLMHLAGRPLPEPSIPWLATPLIFMAFWVAGIGEELGWSATAADPLQDRFGALKGSLILGVIWATWHLTPFIQTGENARWILWQVVWTIGGRMVMVWIYNNAGRSTFSTLVYHAAANVGWAVFPNYGSHYDPFFSALVLLGVLAVILALFDWRTFTRLRWRARRMAPEPK